MESCSTMFKAHHRPLDPCIVVHSHSQTVVHSPHRIIFLLRRYLHELNFRVTRQYTIDAHTQMFETIYHLEKFTWITCASSLGRREKPRLMEKLFRTNVMVKGRQLKITNFGFLLDCRWP